MKPDNDELARRVEQQAQRMQRAERDHPTLLTQTIYLGSLGLMFILPVIAGVYLGHWLDGKLAGYSMRWTLSLLFAGLVIGGFNVYWLIRSQD